jgi:hypothetical protein
VGQQETPHRKTAPILQLDDAAMDVVGAGKQGIISWLN